MYLQTKTLDLSNIPGVRVHNLFFVNYPNLETLSLRGLPITSIPQSLLSLKKLKILDVSNTLLETIPLALAKMPSLTTLICNDMTELEPPFYEWAEAGTVLQNLKKWCRTYPPLPWSTFSSQGLKVFSWNLLSQSAIRRHLYPLTNKDHLQFDHRWLLIKQHLLTFDADIFCVQELQGFLFDELLLDFQKKGFNGFYSPRARYFRRSAEEKPLIYGQATFYRQEFELISTKNFDVRSDPIVQNHEEKMRFVKFDDVANFTFLRIHGKPVLIINVHALYFPELEDIRSAFMNIILFRGKQFCGNGNMIVAGDFNASGDAESLAVCKRNGMNSVYPTLGLLEPPTLYMAPSIKRADHIVFCGPDLKPIEALPVVSEAKAREHFLFIPNDTIPSDHLPIGAVFDLL